METTHEYTRYHTTTVYTHTSSKIAVQIHSICLAPILEVHLSCSSSSFDHYTIDPIRFELSPTNQNRPSIDTQIQRASQQHYLLSQRQDQRTVKSRTSQTSHFSSTGKTKAGLFRLHQQHTHLDITGEDGPSYDQQSNLTCLIVLSEPTSRDQTEPQPLCQISDLAAF